MHRRHSKHLRNRSRGARYDVPRQSVVLFSHDHSHAVQNCEIQNDGRIEKQLHAVVLHLRQCCIRILDVASRTHPRPVAGDQVENGQQHHEVDDAKQALLPDHLQRVQIEVLQDLLLHHGLHRCDDTRHNYKYVSNQRLARLSAGACFGVPLNRKQDSCGHKQHAENDLARQAILEKNAREQRDDHDLEGADGLLHADGGHCEAHVEQRGGDGVERGG